MKADDLCDWLTDEGIRPELDAISSALVTTELDNVIPTEGSAPASIDWPRVLLAGSILARSIHRQHLEAALRIATGALTLSESISTRDAGAVLLTKLSNNRAIDLANSRELLASDLNGRLGITLRLETLNRKMDHTVLAATTGEWIEVNRFQKDFWETVSRSRWLSASAPTASGKTYLVLRWMVEYVRSNDVRVAIYLAPTRALVSEVEHSLAALLGADEAIHTCSLPLRDKYRAARRGETRVVFVLTQERIHLLANALKNELSVDLLIVDEAHKIGDDRRGVILQDAVERACRSNPELKVVFISPTTENPEELLVDAPAGTQTNTVSSDVPTVLQNLLLAQQVPGKPRLWRICALRDDRRLPIGTLQLSNSPSNLAKKIAFIAASAGERGGTLVYANDAGEAEKIARLIAQLVPILDAPDPETMALADLARKCVHPQFLLATVVERGVGFHYGNMPSLIRGEVERLFRTGKLRFLVCTSTLIEGVNLSCRTIVMRGPRKGRGQPMEPPDFWNLAGRAGRWGDEFQGNIICIDPQDTDAWPNGIPRRARYPIQRESDAVIARGDGLLHYLSKRTTTNVSDLNDAEEYEPVGAYLLSTYLRLGSTALTELSRRHDTLTIDQLEQVLASMAKQLEIGPEIAERHPGVSAIGLQRLLEAFREYKGDVENLLPAPVESYDSRDRLATIMRRINQHLYPAFTPEKRIPLYALIVVQWLEGKSLAAIIRGNIAWHEKNQRPYKLPNLIRETMQYIEENARFTTPKFLSAYLDTLHLHLHAIGRPDLVDDDIDIGTQLEFGVSTKTLLSLMELGLSRMTAVALYDEIAKDNLTADECLAWIAEHEDSLEALGVPTLIARETREALGISRRIPNPT